VLCKDSNNSSSNTILAAVAITHLAMGYLCLKTSSRMFQLMCSESLHQKATRYHHLEWIKTLFLTRMTSCSQDVTILALSDLLNDSCTFWYYFDLLQSMKTMINKIYLGFRAAVKLSNPWHFRYVLIVLNVSQNHSLFFQIFIYLCLNSLSGHWTSLQGRRMCST